MPSAFGLKEVSRAPFAFKRAIRFLGLPSTVVNAIAEIAANDHFTARGSFVEARHPLHGAFRQLGPVLAGNARECRPHQVATAGTTDTDAVLGEAGFDATEIARLRHDGVVE